MIQEELNNGDNEIVINQLEIEGLNTTNMVELISPQEVPFNISTDVSITEYTGFSLDQTVSLGNDDCSFIYNNLTQYDNNNYTGTLVVDIDDTLIYNTNGRIETHDDHYICYLHNHPYGKK